MGKLGKNARKIAKKNLQSVLKRKRKLKSMFKKKGSKRDKQDGAENLEEDQIGKSNGRDLESGENIEDAAPDAVFSDESNVVEDDSESDGYLSEDLGCAYLDENGSESNQDDMDVDNNGASDLLVQNREILLELTEKRKKLERLQKKEKDLDKLRDEENEADNIFRGMLGISCSGCKKETLLELKNTSKWKTMKPLIKSYLRRTLFLLNQVTDSEILAFSLVRLRTSRIFFAAFRPLLHRLIKIINGVAVLFPGPRYLPLRLKCIHWLINLSSASGVFIPVASFALDILEYKTGKDNGKPGKDFNFSSTAKTLVKISKLSRKVCFFFPELATIPLIRLRKFHETTTIESFRRVVKRFIDQFEKSSAKAPFTQYYKSIGEKATSRNLVINQKISSLFQKKSKQKNQQLRNDTVHVGANDEKISDGQKK
ncbi:hypothetical protein REPUB_Repub03eG0191600 [Reevesia pubescens]